MAATIEKSALTEAERRRIRAGRGRKPAGVPSFEVFSWFFMRISGMFLVFLALGHFATMHIINDVRDTNFDFVVGRWGNPLWRVIDWLLLALGLFHGMIGMKTILEDLIRNKRKLLAAKVVLYAAVGSMFALGSVIVFTFGSLVARS